MIPDFAQALKASYDPVQKALRLATANNSDVNRFPFNGDAFQAFGFLYDKANFAIRAEFRGLPSDTIGSVHDWRDTIVLAFNPIRSRLRVVSP